MTGSASSSGSYSAGTLTWNVGTLSAAGSGSVTFQATVNAGVASGTLIANSASLTCPAAPLAATATAAITVLTPVLTLSNTTDQAYYAPGAVLTCTLHYGDTLANATNVSLSDALPANLTYVTGSASNSGSYSGGMLTWSLGNLTAGAGGTVTFQATVNAGLPTGTPITNTAGIACTEAPTAVSSTATITVTAPALSLTLTPTSRAMRPAPSSPARCITVMRCSVPAMSRSPMSSPPTSLT